MEPLEEQEEQEGEEDDDGLNMKVEIEDIYEDY